MDQQIKKLRKLRWDHRGNSQARKSNKNLSIKHRVLQVYRVAVNMDQSKITEVLVIKNMIKTSI